MFLAPHQRKTTVFTRFWASASKNHGIYSVLWPGPSKNTAIYAVSSMLSEAFFRCQRHKNIVNYRMFTRGQYQKIMKNWPFAGSWGEREIDRWMDGWIDRQTDRQVDGSIARHIDRRDSQLPAGLEKPCLSAFANMTRHTSIMLAPFHWTVGDITLASFGWHGWPPKGDGRFLKSCCTSQSNLHPPSSLHCRGWNPGIHVPDPQRFEGIWGQANGRLERP